MSGKSLSGKNPSGNNVEKLYFADDPLKNEIARYTERSTLGEMEPPVENCILVYASAPGEFSSATVDDPTSISAAADRRQRGLFTNELMRLIGTRDPIDDMLSKVRSLVTTGEH